MKEFLTTLEKVNELFMNPESASIISSKIQSTTNELSILFTKSSKIPIKFYKKCMNFPESNEFSSYLKDFYKNDHQEVEEINFSIFNEEEFVFIVKKRFVLLEGDFPPLSESESKEREELLFALNI